MLPGEAPAMVHAQKKRNFYLIAPAILLLLAGGQMFAQQDPPSRVARLNYINGNVSMEPAGVDDWAPADLNRPFTIGDYLYADQNSQAELHLDVAAIRIGPQTSFGFLNLDDQTVQLKLTEGDMYIRVRNFGSGQMFEVDTPNVAVTLLRDGIYRLRVDANGNMSFVVVREGQAQITGGGQAFTLNADNSATLTGTDQVSYDIELAPQPDEFDQWCQQRDAHEAQLEASRYVSPNVVGYEDLDDYGSWQNTPDYGPVWYPQNVAVGWAPYHNGHWAWIDPWGWTWIDSMPWGFAPFHYGRWAYIGNRWGWCPGPLAGGPGVAVRPYYAPAMVAWFGGANWGVGISSGGGPSLGWVPLGWGEVYTPAYQCSPRYFNNVNVYNTRVVNTVNITNVYNTVYVNKTVYNRQFVNARAPNAVMAMPQSAFASGALVTQAARPVSAASLARVQTASVVAPPVAPTRQSVLATAVSHPAARPAPQVINRQVVAKNTPPPKPAPFAARQQYLQQHVGQPVNTQAVREAVPAARPVAANVRQAPAATPVVARPGQSHGAAAASVGRNQPAPQPNRTPAQPAAVSPPAPSAHGVPPNMRQSNTQPATAGRYTEPARQTAPVSRPAQAPEQTPQRPQPTTASRPQQVPSEPASERPIPPARPTTQEEPRQPATERPSAPRPAPREVPSEPASERPVPPARPAPQEEPRQPAAERPPAAARPAPEQERAQPAERPATAPRPAPQQERSEPRPAATPSRPEPQAEKQTQSAPERRGYPTRSSESQEQRQPQRQPPPKNDKSDKKQP